MNSAKHAGVGADGMLQIPITWQPAPSVRKVLAFGEELIVLLPDTPKNFHVEVETAWLVIWYRNTTADDFETVHLPSLPPLAKLAVEELLNRFKGILEAADVREDMTQGKTHH